MMSLVELSKSFNTFSHRLFFWRGLGSVVMALVHVSLSEMKVPYFIMIAWWDKVQLQVCSRAEDSTCSAWENWC